jgi:hypothetical protein
MPALTLAVAIPHADWAPRRKSNLAVMREMIEGDVAAYYEYPNRSPCNDWAGHVMGWGAAQKTSHFVLLQDDLLLAEHFAEMLHLLVAAMPADVIGLHTIHPGAPALAHKRGRWCATMDGLVGPQYVFPQPLLEAYCLWTAKELKDGWRTAITEDTLIDVWALATGRRIVHPIPAIADHDGSIPSTWGNAGHLGACAKWSDGGTYGWWPEDLREASFWAPPAVVPNLGRYFCSTTALCEKWVKGWTLSMSARAGGRSGVR